MLEDTSCSPSSRIAALQVSASPSGSGRPVHVERSQPEREHDTCLLEHLRRPEADHLSGGVERDGIQHEARSRTVTQQAVPREQPRAVALAAPGATSSTLAHPLPQRLVEHRLVV